MVTPTDSIGAQTGQQMIPANEQEPDPESRLSRGLGKDRVLTDKAHPNSPPHIRITGSSPAVSGTLSGLSDSECPSPSPYPNRSPGAFSSDDASPDAHAASKGRAGDSFLLRSSVEIDIATLPDGYVGKRKNETEQERELRKAWERDHLTASQRKQLRKARREHKKAVLARREAKKAKLDTDTPCVVKRRGVGAARLKETSEIVTSEGKWVEGSMKEDPVELAGEVFHAAKLDEGHSMGDQPRPGSADEGHQPTESEEDKSTWSPIQETSCCCLSRECWLRKKLLDLVAWPGFDQFILVVIILNCIALALFDPLDEDCDEDKCKVLSYAEIAFNVVFIMEMLIKMVALGVWGESGYLDDAWNRLDFFIVVTSIVDFIPGNDSSSMSAFRAFRVLRPLRAINRFPNLRVLVKLLLNTLPMLASVGVLCFLLFFVLGVLGIQLWSGVLQQRCMDPTTMQVHNEESDPYLCTQPSGLDYDQNGWSKCPPDGFPTYTQCVQDEGNPFWGSISFDHIWAAWVTLFQVLTLEAWVDILYLLQGAYSFHVWIYFVCVVVLCPVFALNLVLVVISAHFGQTKDADRAEMAERNEQTPGQEEDAEDPSLKYMSSKVAPEGADDEVRSSGVVQESSWLVYGRRLIEGHIFNNFIMGCIVVNMLFMAAEHHGQSDFQTDIADWANAVLCWIFFAEMAIKIAVLGLLEYLSDSFNVFDAIIVIVSLIEFFLSGSGGLSVLRTFRLVRAFKLIRFIESLQMQIMVIMKTLTDMVAFFILLFLFIFIFAILGMNLFGGKWDFEKSGTPPRKNFDTFMWALVTVFQVLTLEDWNVVMYDAVRAGGMLSPLYFIALIILGNFIILNLFVAILIGGFEELGGQATSDESADKKLQALCQSSYVDYLEKKYLLANSCYDTQKLSDLAKSVQGSDEIKAGVEVQVDGQDALVMQIENIDLQHPDMIAIVRMTHGAEKSIEVAQLQKIHYNSVLSTSESPIDLNCFQRMSLSDNSLGCFSKDCCLRQACCWLVKQTWFEVFVLSCIIGNSICIAIENPGIDDNSNLRRALDCIGYIFTGIFSIELFVKVIAMNLVFGPEMQDPGPDEKIPGPYLSQGWNRLDCFLVISSWVDLTFTIIGISSSWVRILRVFRMLRTLRPLRMINKAKKLRNTVNSLISSLLPLGSTLIIIMFVFLVFGILGMQLFSGMFYYCDGLTETQLESVETKEQCIAVGGSWKNQVYTFDNIGDAFITLFVVATIDGWVEIMYLGIDVVGEDKQPKQDHSSHFVIFFVLFVMIGAFFSLNIFVGVVVENFQQARRAMAKQEFDAVDMGGDGGISKEEFAQVYGEAAADILFDKVDQDKSGFISREEFEDARLGRSLNLTKTSREAIAAAEQIKRGDLQEEQTYEELLQQHHDQMDPDSMQAAIYRLCTSTRFEMVILSAIGLNILLMGAEYHNQPDKFIEAIKWANVLFTLIFIAEAGFKLYAFGCRLYWSDSWNCFDMFVVLVSIMGSVFDIIGAESIPVNPTLLRLLRILRVARVLKVLKNARNLMILLGGVRGALPHVANLTVLMCLLLFIFSAMGVELFGTIVCNDDHPCNGMSKYANFENFGIGMLTLFRVVTGDNWNGIFKDALRQAPDCNDSTECEGSGANCCTPMYLSIPYFIVFNVASQLLLLNIIVALLMEELEQATLDIGAEEKNDGSEEQEIKEEDSSKVSTYMKPAGSDKEQEITKEH